MALTVEDGSGVVGAESYASASELSAYAAHRLDLSNYSSEQIESALAIASADWLDGTHRLSGTRLNSDQSLHFPTIKHGFPRDIKIAAMKAALLELQGALRVDYKSLNPAGVIESESKGAGTLKKSVTYRAGSAQIHGRILPADLTRLLAPYLEKSLIGGTMRL